ncbi:hypothetical protein AB832_06800 [Flavobacteriaceae bacterium (ex Bugula neritina AB1)]|nr:hypothetical protein AB832_06800 [Flavobacteriaceae bacterium (ex Bugula neritina AB1)]
MDKPNSNENHNQASNLGEKGLRKLNAKDIDSNELRFLFEQRRIIAEKCNSVRDQILKASDGHMIIALTEVMNKYEHRLSEIKKSVDEIRARTSSEENKSKLFKRKILILLSSTFLVATSITLNIYDQEVAGFFIGGLSVVGVTLAILQFLDNHKAV